MLDIDLNKLTLRGLKILRKSLKNSVKDKQYKFMLQELDERIIEKKQEFLLNISPLKINKKTSIRKENRNEKNVINGNNWNKRIVSFR